MCKIFKYRGLVPKRPKKFMRCIFMIHLVNICTLIIYLKDDSLPVLSLADVEEILPSNGTENQAI